MVAIIESHLENQPELFQVSSAPAGGAQSQPYEDLLTLTGRVVASDRYFPEEERSKQPSLFSLVRAVRELFGSPQGRTESQRDPESPPAPPRVLHSEDEQLGMYGAFGYDLTFQFEPVEHKKARPQGQRDLVLFIPDEVCF